MEATKYENIFIDGQDVFTVLKGDFHKLSKWVDNLGYYMVAFRRHGKKKYERVHRLIAETLIPNPNGYSQVNHIDGNKLNNSVVNLEWCSNAYNTQHGYDSGAYHTKHRKHAVSAIKRNSHERLCFDSIRSCAEALHLNRKTITSILKGDKKRNNYPYDFEYIERVSTIPDECKGEGLEISASSEREAA